MNQLKDNIQGLIVMAFCVIYAMGSAHGYNKHNDGMLGWYIPPYGVYRGIEMIWHDDYDGTDWKLQISNDIERSIYLTNAYAYETNLEETLKYMESFSKKISDYPLTQKNKLKKAERDYIFYHMQVYDEMQMYTNALLEGRESDPDKWDKYSKRIYDTLVGVYNITSLIIQKKRLDSLAIGLKLAAGFGELDGIKKTQENVINSRNQIFPRYCKAFLNIFKENY